MAEPFRCRIDGVDTLTLRFGDRIDEEISDRVLALYRLLKAYPIEGVIETIPSYATLTLEFDLFRHSHESLCRRLKELARRADFSADAAEGRRVEIPVYYAPESGADLERLARERGLEIAELIALHSGREYRVYTVGFLPGFAYMGSVDERIAAPRLATPRARVPRGSVAVANRQCAVYPLESPGGWNLLGRTPLRLFDPELEGFSLLRPGDRVRFVPIGREEYLERGGEL
ncbi:5-oxoprolinase subunit PxpB [Nitratifractor sp.]